MLYLLSLFHHGGRVRAIVQLTPIPQVWIKKGVDGRKASCSKKILSQTQKSLHLCPSVKKCDKTCDRR